jgi:hypothetical protein
MTKILPADRPVYVSSEADLERNARIKRINRRKAAKLRKLKKLYAQQAQAKALTIKKKQRLMTSA